MWTRRDQLTAYQFLRGRLVNSLVVADPNHMERPNRRLAIAVAVSTGLAVLALGGVAVYGLLRPGNSTSWQDGRSIIVERETGTRYVLDSEGVLRPALNYASALLFLGGDASARVVSRSSLRETPRGLPIGIPGAPDALPPAQSLLDGPWTACSRSVLDAGGTPSPIVAAQAGMAPEVGELPTEAGLLVESTVTSERYLVYEGRRFQVAGDQVLAGLGWSTATVVPVAEAWLNIVPAGPDLEFLSVEGSGGPGPTIGGRPTVVGQVYELTELSGSSEFFVLAPDGLRSVPGLAAALLLANPRGPVSGPEGMPLALSPSDAAEAPRSPEPGPEPGLPDEVPAPADVTGDQVAVCGTYPDGSGTATLEVRLTPEIPGMPGLPTLPGASQELAPATADRIMVTPGQGAVVRPATDGSSRLAPVSLITDLGVRYPLGSPEVAGVLGYGEQEPAEVPAALLELFPVGPTLTTEGLLDPDDAGASVEAAALSDVAITGD